MVLLEVIIKLLRIYVIPVRIEKLVDLNEDNNKDKIITHTIIHIGLATNWTAGQCVLTYLTCGLSLQMYFLW